MAVWREEVIGRRRVVTADEGGFTVAFFRERDESVWVMLTAGTAYKFDENRPPVLWVDDGPRHDLAVPKGASRWWEDIDGPPVFVSDADHVLARIWHGDPTLDLGLPGFLMRGRQLMIQVYTNAYDVLKYKITLDSPDLIAAVLRLPAE